eukprot:gb/GFBE01081580.1/.p1 GENE.gb/GFBE01081580.1/~~gb/GFBE01081580.1/.p1  ORF type:complete len:461 (+),score=62.93 gb/GFBE01081580.1/:1-1383(+)
MPAVKLWLGLFQGPQRAIVPYVIIWYAVSFSGILLNKSILSPGSPFHAEPVTLALVQTLSTVLLGSVSQSGVVQRIRHGEKKRGTGRRATFVLLGLGVLRFLVIVLGLISLRYVAASFTETIKASSPIFTVIAATLLLGERTEPRVLMSLLLVVGGLASASAAELSFTLVGFAAAVSTNVVECVQNVFCKKLLQDGPDGKPPYTPSQLQYYSAAASLVVQLPLFVGAFCTGRLALPNEAAALAMLGLAGFVYYLQSALVFKIMSHYSPVTVSVLNTAKRALIICLCSVYFGNIITPVARFGTAVTLLGSGLYSYMKCTSKALDNEGSASSQQPAAPARGALQSLQQGGAPMVSSSSNRQGCAFTEGRRLRRPRPSQRSGAPGAAPLYAAFAFVALSSAVRASGMQPRQTDHSAGSLAFEDCSHDWRESPLAFLSSASARPGAHLQGRARRRPCTGRMAAR